MNTQDFESIQLDMFQGPMPFLLHLIQKSEIDICDLHIKEITKQYLAKIQELIKPSFESGAEFIGRAAFLLFLKSKTLLPKDELLLDEEEDLELSCLFHVLDYCKIKEATLDLKGRFERQTDHHYRGIHDQEIKEKGLGLENLAISDLSGLLQEVLKRKKEDKGIIHEETYLISDKIDEITKLINIQNRIGFFDLFTTNKPRGELIVTFLAILELMKAEVIGAVRETETNKVFIVAKDG